MPTWAAGNVELSDEFGGCKNTTSGGKKKLTSLRDNEKKRYFQSVYLDPAISKFEFLSTRLGQKVNKAMESGKDRPR